MEHGATSVPISFFNPDEIEESNRENMFFAASISSASIYTTRYLLCMILFLATAILSISILFISSLYSFRESFFIPISTFCSNSELLMLLLWTTTCICTSGPKLPINSEYLPKIALCSSMDSMEKLISERAYILEYPLAETCMIPFSYAPRYGMESCTVFGILVGSLGVFFVLSNPKAFVIVLRIPI